MSITFTLADDFISDWYTLSVVSCGNRTLYKVLVNGAEEATVRRSGSGFGLNQMTANEADTMLFLKPGDILAIAAPSDATYGWVDCFKLNVYTGDIQNEDYFIYDVEDYSGTIKENAAADMQPGESIDIPLPADFSGGRYTVSINSCGNRTNFKIYVNDVSYGDISRSGTGFGMNQMTLDELERKILTLSAGDVITVVAPADGYGWVDYIELSKSLPPEATKTGDGYYIYHTEYFYDGTIKENVAADMQPGEKISHSLSANKDFVAWEYWVAVYSCGSRESIEVQVNGERVGNILRTATGYGQDQMTYDKLESVLDLKPDDVVSIVAPAEGYGWVDFMLLDLNAVAQLYTDGVAGHKYDSLQKAINAAAQTGSDVKLLADSDEEISISNSLKIDLNGHNLNGKVTVAEGAALYGVDTSTDDYDCSNGYGKIAQLEGNFEPYFQNTDTKWYIAIEEEDSSISFHRFYMAINHKLLRPENNGVGFRAIFAGDEVIKNNLDSFGIQVCVGDDFTVNPVIRTGAFTDFTAGRVTEAGELTNIPNQKTVVFKNLLNTEDGYDNAAAAVADIHGRPYMIIGGHEIVAHDTATSLRELINSANDSDGTPGSVLMAIYNQFVVPFGNVMKDDT